MTDMIGLAFKNHEVLRPIVGLVFVDVVDDFAGPQRPFHLLRCDKAMLVDVPTHVSIRVIRRKNQHIPCGILISAPGISWVALSTLMQAKALKAAKSCCGCETGGTIG